jgi:hypothetical protein
VAARVREEVVGYLAAVAAAAAAAAPPFYLSLHPLPLLLPNHALEAPLDAS